MNWVGMIGCGVVLSMVACHTAKPKVDADAAPKASASEASNAQWISLFDGKSLGHWAPSKFGTQGEVAVEKGAIFVGFGDGCSGVTWTKPGMLPTMDYEIELQAKRVDGNDFFCGLTFPFKDSHCSLILGGWGGGLVGLSSLDGFDAANNDTSSWVKFENGKWYTIRLRVRPKNISAWIDGEKIVDADLMDRAVSIRLEVEESKPLGLATWTTSAAYRNIRLRRLPAESAKSGS